MDDEEKEAAKERAAFAQATIMAELQHADAVTVLATALERHTLTMNSMIRAMEQHNQAMDSLGRALPDQ